MAGIGTERFVGSRAFFSSFMYTAAWLFIRRRAMASAIMSLTTRSRKAWPIRLLQIGLRKSVQNPPKSQLAFVRALQ